jgi:cytochrome c biogenesis protein CcmG/thiol:disulfide interchange protein DsbE
LRTSTISTRTVRNGWLLLAGLAALLLLVIWLRPLEPVFRKTAANHRGTGKQAPSAVLQPLTAGVSRVNLAELDGKVVLVNVWGTWCPACREELPRLAELAKRYDDHDDFRLVTISCPAGFEENLDELAASTADYLRYANLSVPAYADADGTLRAGLREVDAFDDMFPVTLLLDRHGVIRAVWDGHAPEQELERLIASLLVQR